MATLSCQARVSEGNRRVEKPPQHALNKIPEPRPWPSAYPQPTGLTQRGSDGLFGSKHSLRANRGGAFADEVKKRIVQELGTTGISLANENEAESVLSVSMYLSCEPDGPSCGHHTTLEFRQRVQLERDPRITVAAITWQNSYSNGIGRKNISCCLPDLLEADALSLIKAFIGDDRMANSK